MLTSVHTSKFPYIPKCTYREIPYSGKTSYSVEYVKYFDCSTFYLYGFQNTISVVLGDKAQKLNNKYTIATMPPTALKNFLSYVYTRHGTGGHAPNACQLAHDCHTIAFTRLVEILLHTLNTVVMPIINEVRQVPFHSMGL